MNVSVRWSVRQTNGVYLHYFSSTYNFLSLLSCGSLGQVRILVLCWYKQILQPSSLHFRTEPHVVEKPEAGECESGRISECTERQCLDAVRCAHLFDVMTSNTTWILVKTRRSGWQNVRNGGVSVLQASIIQNFLGWWDCCCSTLYRSYVGEEKDSWEQSSCQKQTWAFVSLLVQCFDYATFPLNYSAVSDNTARPNPSLIKMQWLSHTSQTNHGKICEDLFRNCQS